jgi:excinuclease ABC subunit C
MNQVEKAMKAAAKAEDFERAATLRNQLLSLKALRRQVVFGDREFMDISKDQGLAELQDLLDLAQPPRRIEGYDISHMSGTDTVASMVVFTSGLPDKSQYRKFKMRLPGNDDFAHMNEVITRRFSGRHQTWPKPDLVLIDGGKGQLTSALAALEALGVSLPAIGLAKRQETIIVKTKSGFDSIQLPSSSAVIKLLQRVRDESHRFALSYHSTLKTKRQSSSILNDIPGVGPATRKKLLKTFGSLRGINRARQFELERVVGAKQAAVIKQYLRREHKLNPPSL